MNHLRYLQEKKYSGFVYIFAVSFVYANLVQYTFPSRRRFSPAGVLTYTKTYIFGSIHVYIFIINVFSSSIYVVKKIVMGFYPRSLASFLPNIFILPDMSAAFSLPSHKRLHLFCDIPRMSTSFVYILIFHSIHVVEIWLCPLSKSIDLEASGMFVGKSPCL